jgi:hypothetical protein
MVIFSTKTFLPHSGTFPITHCQFVLGVGNNEGVHVVYVLTPANATGAAPRAESKFNQIRHENAPFHVVVSASAITRKRGRPLLSVLHCSFDWGSLGQSPAASGGGSNNSLPAVRNACSEGAPCLCWRRRDAQGAGRLAPQTVVDANLVWGQGEATSSYPLNEPAFKSSSRRVRGHDGVNETSDSCAERATSSHPRYGKSLNN